MKDEVKDFDNHSILGLKVSENDKRRQEIEDMLNYQLQIRRQQGIDPAPVIVGFSHIYNTYSSVERGSWQKTGFARLRSFRL